MILALLLQAATGATPASAASPQRFSILTDPCANASNDGGDVVVCGRPDTLAPRLPMPRLRGAPDHPVPSNPDMKASVALDGPGVGNVCGAYGEDCPIAGGGDHYIGPLDLASAAVKGVKSAFAKRRYKDKGEPIPLDDPPVGTRGRVLP